MPSVCLAVRVGGEVFFPSGESASPLFRRISSNPNWINEVGLVCTVSAYQRHAHKIAHRSPRSVIHNPGLFLGCVNPAVPSVVHI